MATAEDDLDTVTGTFRRLKTAEERNIFIQSILESLPRQHVRELACQAASVHFLFDIIGNLPIEILCLIFRDLPIYQAFQLRRVSKTWLKKVSAPAIVKSMLQPWFAMGDVNLRMPQDLSIDEALVIHAEHVDALKTGNPFSMVQGQWDVDLPKKFKSRPTNIDYSHGRLAWISREDGRLHVRNLEFGQETLYTPPNRERTSMIRLSSTIVAATTDSGRCYAWDCITGARHSIRFPSAASVDMTASHKSLAILRVSAGGRLDITTYNLDSRRTRSFQATMQGRAGIHGEQSRLDMTMTEDFVLLVELDMGPPDEIFFTRYTLEGKIIAKGNSGLLHRAFRAGYLSSLAFPPQRSTFSALLTQLDRIKVKQEPDKAFRKIRRTLIEECHGIVRIVYDLRNDRIASLDMAAINCKESDIHRNGGGCWLLWKDAALRFAYDDDGLPSSAAVDLQTGARTNIYMHDHEHGFGQQWATEPIRFYGDEIYMVKVSWGGFTAYCFDKNITMEGEESDFRQQREAARLERIRIRDQVESEVSDRPFTGPSSIEEMEAKLAQHEQELWAQEYASDEDSTNE